ncbi:MAG: VWA domain-containing protein [Clostridia bacterium]|nr:VWA domain-containing protein [Clostridia bacterium]
MNNNNKALRTVKKISKIFLALFLVLGILSSTFGVCVLALSSSGNTGTGNNNDNGENDFGNSEPVNEYVAPTDQYKDIGNEIELKDSVVVLTENESKDINRSIVAIENVESGYEEYLQITLNTSDLDAIDKLQRNKIIYLHGDQNTPFGEDRIMKIDRISKSGGMTVLRTTEPYFEDVFTSMEICASDALTEDNFVKAYYANGVTSHFGEINDDVMNVSTSSFGTTTVQPIYTTGSTSVVPLGDLTQHQTKSEGLIVEIDYDFNKNKKDDKKDEDSSIDKSFGIKGKFGIRDLTAHMVCDMPTVATFEELYFGVSGETFVNVTAYGSISAKAEMEAEKKDLLLCTLEGLNEKRFPIAVFQFKGTTPVYITNKAFEKGKESLVPSLYIMLYADWEGKISLELSGGFDYKEGFNNGVRIFKNGEPCLSFENYPYTTAYNVEDEDGFNWYVDLTLDANTDLTIFGGSLLFYVAGVNLGEISVARIGIQAACKISLKASSQKGLELPDKTNTDLYIRGYLKLIEAKVKLKAEGKSFLKKLSIDVDFEFALIDITLFEAGNRPDKYKPKMPISSIIPPTEFDSVISLVFDVSGSMNSKIDTGETKLEAAKKASEVIISTTKSWSKNNSGVYGVGIIKFESSATTVSVPHIDYKYLNECIATLDDGGGTNIASGINMGVSQLDTVKSSNKVIILMTDGQDSSNSVKAAEDAAAKGIKIYTIGFGNDVNENILKQIAEKTGGEYQFANTDNIIGIMGSFMYAQTATNSDVIKEVEGAVSEGETSTESKFEVKESSGDLTVSTVWPGSFLDTILVDPNGRVVDEEYPNAYTDESQIPSIITVKNPIEGKWSVKVKGIECSYEKEPFYTIVSFNEAEETMLNSRMSDMENIAAYCIPIGLIVSIASIMLLVCLKEKKEKIEDTQE